MAGLILTGCGSAGTGSGSTPGVTPGVTPSAPHFDVAVTEKDTVAKMRVGQKLELVLRSSPNMNGWSLPRSSNETVLAPIANPARTAALGVRIAAFQALAPGEADITAIASPLCSPGQACPMYVALYSLRVTVSA